MHYLLSLGGGAPCACLQKTATKNCRVLWVAPNLNHYKSRFLNRLAEEGNLDLVILAGSERFEENHSVENNCEVISTHIDKPRFGFSVVVVIAFIRLVVCRRFNVVLMPLEKKLLPLIVTAWVIRRFMRFQLTSYNHPLVRCGTVRETERDVRFSRILFSFYDRVIFYTENSCQWAVARGLISPEKASFANNTLDTTAIWSNYTFEINRREPTTILYIGRLIRSKGVQDVLAYFDALSATLPQLQLIVIGDGPQADVIKSAARECPRITWCGAIVDEVRIARYMRESHIVFIPGASGLSIVHAFCYGKPYITLAEDQYPHGPEISYLADGVNGLLLSGNMSENIDRVTTLLTCDKHYAAMCEAAMKSARRLSVDEWCRQMRHALTSAWVH